MDETPMNFADIYIPYPVETPFTYRVPPGMSPGTGYRVRVDFGGRLTTGWVAGVHDNDPGDRFPVKDILEVVDEAPLFDGRLLDLARYVADYYLSTPGETLALALPGAESRSQRHRRTVDAASLSHELTGFQGMITDSIMAGGDAGRLRHLLFGVTGSGKTEVYMELARRVMERGRSVLYLVPEIMLSGQIFRRLESFFGDDLVLYHSGLTPPQRLYNWHRFRTGDARIAVGTRSAVFMQAPDLGLVIVDEEHDSSYKEQSSPRYNARRVALRRSETEGALLVLGSATPSVESLYSAERGQMVLHRMDSRWGGRPMPGVEIVSVPPSARGSLSAPLKVQTRRAVEAGNQVILLLNRRGHSPFVVCDSCGKTVMCPHCSISLAYHRTGDVMCHYCGHRQSMPEICPMCGQGKPVRVGAGTQRVEDEINAEFGDLTLFRLDQDTAHRRNTAKELVEGMESGDIDILLGTQMVAKGFDFPGVSVVGVLLADIGLNLPDFRSGERIFSLLVQVAGRCGRGDDPGRVIVQTLDRSRPLFDFVSRHDYYGFYRQELEIRKGLGYPPFGRLVRLLVRGRDETRVRDAAIALGRRLETLRRERKVPVTVMGPAEAPIAKIGGNFRHHILLKGPDGKALRELARTARDAVTDRTCYLEIDMDPVDVL